jgi:hypothetical protein
MNTQYNCDVPYKSYDNESGLKLYLDGNVIKLSVDAGAIVIDDHMPK